MSRPLAHPPSLRACSPKAGHTASSESSSAADRWLLFSAIVALVLANVRYWMTVFPRVRKELDRWERAAREITDPDLRALAVSKLEDERFNSEAAATLATLAPLSRRKIAVKAIVALQVMYDYLDVLGEQPGGGSLPQRAFTDALSGGGGPCEDYYQGNPLAGDGGYLRELRDTVIVALERLPAKDAIAQIAQAAAERCSHAQILNHSARGTDELTRWASSQAAGSEMGWQEFLAGASASVLGVHALIAAAARDGTTRAHAAQIDELYMSIGALSMLDSLIDEEQDSQTGQHGYLHHYGGDVDLLTQRLSHVVHGVLGQARGAPNGAHHVMTLAGVISYYGSATREGVPLTARIGTQMRPLIAPTLWLMRAWRAAKQLHHRKSSRVS